MVRTALQGCCRNIFHDNFHDPWTLLTVKNKLLKARTLSTTDKKYRIPPKSMSDTFEPGTVVIPGRNDVLFGRGSGQVKHPGNTKLYEIVGEYLPQYLVATSRSEKSHVVESIYSTLRTMGRFVRVDQETGACFMASNVQAKSKIGHAMRYQIKLKSVVSSSAQRRTDKSLHTSDIRKSVTSTENADLQQYLRRHPTVTRLIWQDQEDEEEDDEQEDEIFLYADLLAVIGYPGEMDIPTQILNIGSLEDDP